jgi:hypothetical protein
LPLAGPSSALAVKEQIITVEKAAVTSDPAMVVIRRELMFAPLGCA